MPVNKSKAGRDELRSIVRHTLNLSTSSQAEHIISSVVGALEQVLLNNLTTNGFTIKLGNLGKFTIHHRPSILRKIPFTGEIKPISAKRKVKFVALGRLRQRGRVEQKRKPNGSLSRGLRVTI